MSHWPGQLLSGVIVTSSSHMISRAFPEVVLAVVGRLYPLHRYKFLNTLNDDCLEKLVHVRCHTMIYLENMLTAGIRYNKYASITARAVRASLKEEERVVAEKRGLTSARYQKWENGVGGQYVREQMHQVDNA